jgi:hypothetical protein
MSSHDSLDDEEEEEEYVYEDDGDVFDDTDGQDDDDDDDNTDNQHISNAREVDNKNSSDAKCSTPTSGDKKTGGGSGLTGGSGSTTDLTSVPYDSFHIMESLDIEKIMRRLVHEVATLLDVSFDVSKCLLQNNKWNKEKLIESFFANSEKVMKNVSVSI